MLKPHSEIRPQAMQPTYAGIIKLTDPFCKQYLNDEYAALCRSLAATLARKRPLAVAPRPVGNLGLRNRICPWHCQLPF